MNPVLNQLNIPESKDNMLLLHLAYTALFNIRYGFTHDINETCDLTMQALKKEMDRKHD